MGINLFSQVVSSFPVYYFSALWQNHQSNPSYFLSRSAASFTLAAGGTIA